MSIVHYNQLVIYILIMSQCSTAVMPYVSNIIFCCSLSRVLNALMHCSWFGDRKGMLHVKHRFHKSHRFAFGIPSLS